MIVTFGKSKGSSVERLVLTAPLDVLRLLGRKSAYPQGLAVQRELLRLIGIFDSKPIVKKCMENSCAQAATQVTAYHGSSDLRWWCQCCAPRLDGGKILPIATYHDAITHVAMSCNGRIEPTNRIVRALAASKGLAYPVTQAAARAFFCESFPDLD